MRRKFVADLEACIKAADGRIFPWVLQLLWQTYAYIGEPEKACATLQHAYRFEPAVFAASAWQDLFKDVENTARQPGPQSGLPAFPDFVCQPDTPADLNRRVNAEVILTHWGCGRFLGLPSGVVHPHHHEEGRARLDRIARRRRSAGHRHPRQAASQGARPEHQGPQLPTARS